MTKKDYILLAEVIRASRNGWIAGESSRDQVINHLVVLLARRLKEDNPRFDADKFSRATL